MSAHVFGEGTGNDIHAHFQSAQVEGGGTCVIKHDNNAAFMRDPNSFLKIIDCHHGIAGHIQGQHLGAIGQEFRQIFDVIADHQGNVNAHFVLQDHLPNVVSQAVVSSHDDVITPIKQVHQGVVDCSHTR